MAHEAVCKSCGSTAGYTYQTRCDGCGVVFEEERGTASCAPLVLPDRANSSTLCPNCKKQVLSAVEELLLKCARCGHLRSEHNASCLRLGKEIEPGIREACDCKGWVAP